MLRDRVGARLTVILFLIVVSFASSSVVAQGLTASEALETVRRTGRPLFAVATSPTCGPCLALKSVIHSDASVQAQMSNFVYLEMDSKSPEFAKFREQFQGAYSGVPMVYMIRGDGSVMYGQSGGMAAGQLKSLLGHGLENAGIVLRADELERLEQVYASARQQAESGSLASAMGTITKIAEMKCFAEVVYEARGTQTQLHGLIDQWTQKIDRSIAAGKSVHANAYRLAELYVQLPKSATTLRSNIQRLLNHYENTPTTRSVILQNKRLVRARLEERRDLCEAAMVSYRYVLDLEPDSPAGEFATERLPIVTARRQTKLTSNLGASASPIGTASP